MQVQMNHESKKLLNPIDFVSKIIKERSSQKRYLTTLYKGVTLPFYAQGLYKSVIFTTNSLCNRYLFPNTTIYSMWLSGVIAGTVNSFIVSPIEIIRTRQIIEKNNLNMKLSLSQCITNLYKEYGIIGFWRGVVPTIIRDGPGIGFYLLSFSLTKEYLNNYYYNKNANNNNSLWIKIGCYNSIIYLASLLSLLLLLVRILFLIDFVIILFVISNIIVIVITVLIILLLLLL